MKEKIFQFPDELALMHFANGFAQLLDNGFCLHLIGDLGAGKTTFVRFILRAIGYAGKVKSPTYTIVEPYTINALMINHFDLYRLRSPNEIEALGIREYLTESNINIIEWPEKGYPLLPAPDLVCYIKFISPGREYIFKAHTQRGADLLINI